MHFVIDEGATMMGQTASQDQLFHAFNLTDHVPRGHLLRGIDRLLDLRELRQHLAPFYSDIGRPSIDTELMVCVPMMTYCMSIHGIEGDLPMNSATEEELCLVV